jgi:hypothetical protein
MTGMSAVEDGISEAALAHVFASSGVKVEADEIGSVVRALVRINAAARILLHSSFDDTIESYFRLLEQDDAGAGA